MRAILIWLALSSAAVAPADVTFVFLSADPLFSSLSVYDDYSGVTPLNTGQAHFSSKSIDYFAHNLDVGVWNGSALVGDLASTDIPDFIVTSDGDENNTIVPNFTVRRMGFETFTINEPGNPLSVSGASNVQVTVTTSAGDTVLSLNPSHNNHGFLGIVSDDPIISVRWFGPMGRFKDTGLTNLRVDPSQGERKTISGTLNLRDLGANGPGLTTIEFRSASDLSSIHVAPNIVVDTDGDFSTSDLPVPSGLYNVSIWQKPYLRTVIGQLDTSVDHDVGAITLFCGDVDHDNSVTVFDFVVMSDYFDKTSGEPDWATVGSNGFAPMNADLDLDGSITVFDYNILSNNFDLIGDP